MSISRRVIIAEDNNMNGKSKSVTKQVTTIFLKLGILLIAIGMLAVMFKFPQTEGRNINSDLATIYFNDPFLAYVYLASIPFFIILFQASKLAEFTNNKTKTKKTFRNIKNCAIAMIFFILVAAALILIMPSDDRAGGLAMCIFATFVFILISVGAKYFEKKQKILEA